MVIGHDLGPISQLGMHLSKAQARGQLLGGHLGASKYPDAVQEELPEVKDIFIGRVKGDQGTGAARTSLEVVDK